ncbi:hypothetical protein HMPREF3188_00063 [Tissierellia bacterium KA00581]|nr:hypothetical protein HMPREF3188_00063 [Tissierellia bacterium KA00581]
MQQGWIKIHRKILDNFLWEDKPFSKGQAWIDLILLANHENKKIIFDGNAIEVKRGEKITSIRFLSERWGWSTTKTKKFLNVLQSEKMLTYKSNSKNTVYSIVNYNDYQEKQEYKNNTEVTQKKHRSNTEVTQKNTNKNDKNDKNDKNIFNNLSNDKLFVPLIQKWNELPETVSKISTLKKDTQRYKMLSQRVSEYGENKVLEAIEKIKQSSFLQGSNNKGWTITFEWFVRPNNFVKVLEGNYADKKIQKSNLIKGRYIEQKDILTEQEKAERLKNERSGTLELLEKYQNLKK